MSQYKARRHRSALNWRARLYLLITSLTVCACASATDILILQSHDSPPYRQTLTGFQSGLAGSNLNPTYQSLALANSSETQALSHLLQNYQPQLILTLGTHATRAALTQIKKTPIVAGLVLDTDELRKNANATGVGLNFPASLQWLWLRRLLPDARQIAVLYHPQQGAARFQELQKQAQTEGVTLIKAPAASAKELPALMQNLPPQLDALWAVDSSAAFNAAAVRELLLYSFRNRVPLIGLSAQWVKAGALYALDWDYDDLGIQTADLAKDILLKGILPTSLPPLTPRKVRLVLNLKTAEHMKLEVPEQWLPDMSELIQ